VRVIIQIYGVMNPADAALVAELGADQIGVVVGERGTVWDAVDFEAANRIFSAIKTGATKVALTLSSQISTIEALIRAVHFDILHLAAGVDDVQADQVAELKRRHPRLRVIRTVPVIGPEAVLAATAFEGIADYLLLDSRDPDTMSVGATGRRHDWDTSARIVTTVRTPVILAGGLSPDNVREAIRTVRPWGVDSNTLTSRGDDRTRKDPERVRRFIEAARGAV
jgi:phosphoribosylanthranilate isomerase